MALSLVPLRSALCSNVSDTCPGGQRLSAWAEIRAQTCPGGQRLSAWACLGSTWHPCQPVGWRVNLTLRCWVVKCGCFFTELWFLSSALSCQPCLPIWRLSAPQHVRAVVLVLATSAGWDVLVAMYVSTRVHCTLRLRLSCVQMCAFVQSRVLSSTTGRDGIDRSPSTSFTTSITAVQYWFQLGSTMAPKDKCYTLAFISTFVPQLVRTPARQSLQVGATERAEQECFHNVSTLRTAEPCLPCAEALTG